MKKSLKPLIRFASLDDAESIAINHICSWQEMYKEFIPESVLKNLSVKERAQQWYELIEQKVNVLVLEIEENIVGFASFGIFRGLKNNPLDGEISAIYLHPAYWRLGLGTQLCRVALAELEKLGFQQVFLWVLSDNEQARSFYESLGFEATTHKKMEEFYEGGALLEETLYKKTLYISTAQHER